MRNKQGHVLWCDSDVDAPSVIKDSNGDVVLGLCKNCGRGEVELQEPCSVEMKAKVYWRESTKEWVFQIEGVIGDTNMTCRHTAPASVKMQDVPGLGFIYDKIERLERFKAKHARKKRDDKVIADSRQIDIEAAIKKGER